jgi:hypothetical protein
LGLELKEIECGKTEAGEREEWDTSGRGATAGRGGTVGYSTNEMMSSISVSSNGSLSNSVIAGTEPVLKLFGGVLLVG